MFHKVRKCSRRLQKVLKVLEMSIKLYKRKLQTVSGGSRNFSKILRTSRKF
jgi:hypothetical protein